MRARSARIWTLPVRRTRRHDRGAWTARSRRRTRCWRTTTTSQLRQSRSRSCPDRSISYHRSEGCTELRMVAEGDHFLGVLLGSRRCNVLMPASCVVEIQHENLEILPSLCVSPVLSSLCTKLLPNQHSKSDPTGELEFHGWCFFTHHITSQPLLHRSYGSYSVSCMLRAVYEEHQ